MNIRLNLLATGMARANERSGEDEEEGGSEDDDSEEEEQEVEE